MCCISWCSLRCWVLCVFHLTSSSCTNTRWGKKCDPTARDWPFGPLNPSFLKSREREKEMLTPADRTGDGEWERWPAFRATKHGSSHRNTCVPLVLASSHPGICAILVDTKCNRWLGHALPLCSWFSRMRSAVTSNAWKKSFPLASSHGDWVWAWVRESDQDYWGNLWCHRTPNSRCSSRTAPAPILLTLIRCVCPRCSVTLVLSLSVGKK